MKPMKKQLLLGAVVWGVLFCGNSVTAHAQQPAASRADIFIGYSYLSNGFGANRVGNHGWNLQGTYNLTDNLGLTADFSGHNATTTPFTGTTQLDDMYTLLFGPKLTHHEDNIEMYVHGLVGVMRAHTAIVGSFSTTDTGFGAGVGGGVDWIPSDRWGVRILQLDYIYGNTQNAAAFGPTTINNLRLSAGVVIRLGSR
jgi:hypothetical protein